MKKILAYNIKNHEDLTGKKFGKLTVIKFAYRNPNQNGLIFWLCQCECGQQKCVSGRSLKRGTKSCGCLVKENAGNIHIGTITHGMSNTRLYSIWHGIKGRCGNPNNSAYERYGGRGINVCPEWEKDFMNFYQWAMANGYKEDLTIDRIDNNKGYCPENCRWITNKEQQWNKRTNYFITYNGETHCLNEWAEILNISKYKLWKNIRVLNLDPEKAFAAS